MIIILISDSSTMDAFFPTHHCRLYAVIRRVLALQCSRVHTMSPGLLCTSVHVRHRQGTPMGAKGGGGGVRNGKVSLTYVCLRATNLNQFVPLSHADIPTSTFQCELFHEQHKSLPPPPPTHPPCTRWSGGRIVLPRFSN